jgi:hypothetical protein
MQPDEVKPLLSHPEVDFWDDLPSDVKTAISQAKDEFDRGCGIPHLDVMADIKSRFLNR